MQMILFGIVAMILIIWVVPAIPVTLLGAAIIVVFGFFFATVSSRMVGLVGSSNNPVSGMAIATLLIATMSIKASGKTGIDGMTAAIAIGSVICIVAAIAGDTPGAVNLWRGRSGKAFHCLRSRLHTNFPVSEGNRRDREQARLLLPSILMFPSR